MGSFTDKAPNRVFLSIVLGALAGACYALIIPLVLNAIAPEAGQFSTVQGDTGFLFGLQISNFYFAAVFTAVCLFILVARTVSQVILLRVSMDVTTDLRTRMYRRIANAPIADLERVGLSRIIASITSDVPVIIAGARLLPDLLTNAVTLIGMLGFLLYLNSGVFWFVMCCIVAGVITYQAPMLLARKYLIRARNHLDGLHESIRGLVHGAKELKLHHDKREEYFRQVLAAHENDVRADSKTGQTVLRVAQNYGDLIAFFVIGAVSFVLVNYQQISRQELAGVVMVLLYVTGPVAVLLNFIPQFATAQVSLRKVNELFRQIPEESAAQTGEARRDWSVMRFQGVTYQYTARNEDKGFAIGPLDFEIHKGEVTFIVGGNGSGKSTLAKLITLHYHPREGAIVFDEVPVDAASMAGFRRGITAIYSDYYLFDRALGHGGRDMQTDVDGYLKALALDHKVTFKDGRFSTLSLSDGQKRRLALVAALLDDAELYLFDEWAADQDPAFKNVFYNRILPELKARGKAVVAISHDDRFFHLADRLIMMNDGQVANTEDAALGQIGGRRQPALRDGAAEDNRVASL